MRIAYWRSKSVRVLRQSAANCKKSPRNTNWKLKTLQIWNPMPIDAKMHRCVNILAQRRYTNHYSSADFFIFLCCVLPIRQDITYWYCFTGAETEIHKIKDNRKIKRKTNLDRHGPRPIPIICHLPDPPSFSLPTTFKRMLLLNLRIKVLGVYSAYS